MKNLAYPVIFFAILLLFLPAGVLALEVDYPFLGPGTPLITDGTVTLELFIQYAFIFAYTVAGVIGVIIIVIKGLKILLFAGSPAALNDAKEAIFNVILGIALLFFSFILLVTINPSLVNPRTTPLALQDGFYLYEKVAIDNQHPDGYDYEPAPDVVFDVSAPEYEEYDGLYYYCKSGSGPTILLWTYNKTDLVIDENANGGAWVNTIEMNCGDTHEYNKTFGKVKSFNWEYKSAGIYYYMEEECAGVATFYDEDSPGQQVSGDIPLFNEDQFDIDQTVRSIKIVNDPKQDFNYGVIMNDSLSFVGECSLPIINNTQKDLCVSVGDAEWPVNYNGDKFGFDDDIELGSGPWSVEVIKQAKIPDRGKGISLISTNLAVVYTVDNENPDLSIGKLKHVDGNLDEVLRLPQKVADSSLPYGHGFKWRKPPDAIPPNECDALFDDTFFKKIDGQKNPDYRGFNSCINDIKFDGNFGLYLYTVNDLTAGIDDEDEVRIGCKSFYGSEKFYEPNRDPKDQKIPSVFTEDRAIYDAIIFPSVP